MTPYRDKRDPLEDAITSMKAEEPSPAEVQAASDRVWQRIAEPVESASAAEIEMIRGCADVRALVPLYRSGTLSRARYLLVDDHLKECVACRKFSQARPHSEPEWHAAMPAFARWGAGRFALVAAAVVLAITSFSGYRWFNSAPPGPRATVQSVKGTLYLVSLRGEQPIGPGASVSDNESLRTSNGSHAFIRLADGSVVEMNERAEFSVSARRYDTTVHLDRGRVIVQAAHRSTGHLYVATPDCRVAVTGTVFSVNSGLKGSRVAVIEGEVRVAAEGVESVLHSGDVHATSASMGTVRASEEISWSDNLDQHLALLAEFAKFSSAVSHIAGPDPRYTSKILPLVPVDTVVYASIPNVGGMLSQANQIFQQQMQQSPVLSQWWQQQQANAMAHQAPSPAVLIDRIITVSQYLGDEVVFLAGDSGGGHSTLPTLVAQVTKAGLREYLQAEADKIAANGGTPPTILTPDTLAGVTAAGMKGAVIIVRDDTLILSCNLESALHVNGQFAAGESGFTGSAFGQRIQQAYARGAGVLFAADAQSIMARNQSPEGNAHFQRTGFANLAYVTIERRDVNGQPDNHAAFEFNGPRQAIASWLAPPAPIGSLDFISSDASMAVSMVSKDPAQMLDDVLNLDVTGNPTAQQKLAQLDQELGLDIRQDLAGTLGGDVTLALDGAVLPTPSWKMVIEVYDPARLEASLEKIVAAAAAHAAQNGQPAPTLQREDVNGQAFYVVRAGSSVAVTLHYTFSSGYMIVAPNRALLVAAMQTRQSGQSLAHSSSFKALLPASDQADFSALFYQNLAPVLQPLAEQLTPAQLQSLQQIAADSKPSVVAAYGGPDRVDVASSSRFFGVDLNTLTLSTLLGVAKDRSGTTTPARPKKR